jgi:hypothetical protein
MYANSVNNTAGRIMPPAPPASKAQSSAPNLSLNARNYLAYLESKFSDVNFFVGSAKYSSGIRDFDSDAVYNCFLCPSLIEEMANCTETAAKYEQVIWEMRAHIDNLHYGLKETGLGEYVASYAIEINDDGSVDYVLMLKDSTRGLHGGGEDASPKILKAKSVDELFKQFNSLRELKGSDRASGGGNYDIAEF